jgi:hypothetical protein
LIGRSRIAPGCLFALPAILLSATLDRGSSSAQSPCRGCAGQGKGRGRTRDHQLSLEGASMTQLYALTLTKEQLDQIPDDERLFYFMAGQLHNDINILSKLLIAASNEMKLVFDQEPKRSGASAQALLLLKLTAGRLYEGHKTIRNTFPAKGLLIQN